MTKILIDRTVLEQALNALWATDAEEGTEAYSRELEAIKALRAALEQPQGDQEPVAWLKEWSSVGNARTGMRRVDLTPECETWLANMFPTITPLYTHPQNLNCKSTQHRLATLWGYEKPQPPRQPQVEQEPIGEVGAMPGTTGFTMACFLAADAPIGTKLYANQQPKRESLTEDEIFSAIRPLCNSDTNCKAIIGVSMDEYRAIEEAHGIGGKK